MKKKIVYQLFCVLLLFTSTKLFCAWENLGQNLQDPLLHSLIERATQQNLDIQIAALDGEEEFEDSWISISAEVARNYVELRGLQQRLSLLNQNSASQKETLKLIEELYQQGFVDFIDKKLAEEQWKSLLAEKPQLKQAIEKTIRHLSILLGYCPGELLAELTPMSQLPYVPNRVNDCSPDLRQRADIRKAKKEMLATKKKASGPLAPIIIGFSASKKMSRQAEYQYQKTLLNAHEETENAFSAFHYALVRNKELAEAEASASESYRLSLELYEKGFKSYQEVLTITRSLLAAQDAYVQSQVDVLNAYITLWKATGL